jgi:plastocyanin
MRILLVVSLAALTVAGCGGAAKPSPAHSVSIRDYRYLPATLSVAAGTKVTWTNLDASPHTVSGPGLMLGTLRKGDSRSLTFTRPGTYAYVCDFHPFMHANVVVR